MKLHSRIGAIFFALSLISVSFTAVAQGQLPARIKIGVLDSLTGPAAVGSAGGSQPTIKLAIKELLEGSRRELW